MGRAHKAMSPFWIPSECIHYFSKQCSILYSLLLGATCSIHSHFGLHKYPYLWTIIDTYTHVTSLNCPRFILALKILISIHRELLFIYPCTKKIEIIFPSTYFFTDRFISFDAHLNSRLPYLCFLFLSYY